MGVGDIAVVGATGTVGRRVARRLAADGGTVRAVARQPGGLPDGVRPQPADLTDPDQARTSLRGADGVYLTLPHHGPDPLFLERTILTNVLDAAEAEGVAHVVVHTAMQAGPEESRGNLLEAKAAAEAELDGRDVPTSVLRPAWFAQNVAASRGALRDGELVYPWPAEVAWGWVDAEEVAATAVELIDHGPAEAPLTLQRPEPITGAAIAAACAEVLGTEVVYRDAGVDPATFCRAIPVSPAHQELLAGLFARIASGTYVAEPLEIATPPAAEPRRSLADILRDDVLAPR